MGRSRDPLPRGQEDAEVARERARECLGQCLEYAERTGVTLTLEAINRYETNFLNTADETTKFINEIGSPRLGLHLDTFHMNIEEVAIEQTLRLHADRLAHVHFVDSNRWSPGRGHLDFLTIVRTLKEVGYGGFIGVECLPLPTPDLAAKQTLEYVEALMSLVS